VPFVCSLVVVVAAAAADADANMRTGLQS